MEYVATERIYEPINDDGASVLVYAVGDVVPDEDAGRYPNQVEEIEGENESVSEPEPSGPDSWTRDELVAHYNEQRPEQPIAKNTRRADALAAVHSL